MIIALILEGGNVVTVVTEKASGREGVREGLDP
jgi:hypothetical protein